MLRSLNLLVGLLSVCLTTSHGLAEESARAIDGLQVLYDFQQIDGGVIQDVSPNGQPLNLKIQDTKAIRLTDQGLQLLGKTALASDKPPQQLLKSLRQANAITLEAWITTAKVDQSGPARIISLSKNTSERNVTLGQDGDKFDVRLRTTKRSTNGLPSVNSGGGKVNTKRTHIVYTRSSNGQAAIFLNGKQIKKENVPGDFGNWDAQATLVLGNEATNDRPWLGTFHLVAIYNRALNPQEVTQNFQAGPQGASISREVLEAQRQARHFETKVAQVLAHHCLECHDSVVKKGQLDLSRKAGLLKGGEIGPAITIGNAEDSLLWQYVESDEMPLDRPPLTDDEKQLLNNWINDGAHWSLDYIDPANYLITSKASQTWVRRLTMSEYIATVKATVGVDITEEARRLLPPDLRADGFSNTAYNLGVDLKNIEAYAQLAEIIAQRVDASQFARRWTKQRLLTDKHMIKLIEDMGKFVLRGPLKEHEVASYRGISTTVASAGGDFEEAVSLILEAMLQSPRFIYRIESQQGDGSRWPVTQFELASRMSYILWGASPDQELLRLADQGKLSGEELEKQIDRMLKDARALTRSKEFLAEWLHLDRLNNMQPNETHFPNWNPTLAKAMQQESLLFFEEIAWKQRRPLNELFNAQVTFVTPQLARHYGNIEVTSKDSTTPTRIDLKDNPYRGGLLTQGSTLTVGGDDASMVARGLFVLKDVLRGTVKDPPPCVDTTPVATKDGLTQRVIAEQRIANTQCGACHVKFEPFAFGLEKFDGLGTFHHKDEHGNPLRDDGELLFPGSAESIPYENSAELMRILANNDRVREGLTWKLAQFAMGRPLTANDAKIVKGVHESAWKHGGTYADIITAIIVSDLVQTTVTQANE